MSAFRSSLSSSVPLENNNDMWLRAKLAAKSGIPVIAILGPTYGATQIAQTQLSSVDHEQPAYYTILTPQYKKQVCCCL